MGSVDGNKWTSLNLGAGTLQDEGLVVTAYGIKNPDFYKSYRFYLIADPTIHAPLKIMAVHMALNWDEEKN